MIICQACNAQIDGPDRFCRTCGAPVPPLVGDLADTNRFDPSDAAYGNVRTGPQNPTRPVYVGPQPGYPAPQDTSSAYETGSLAGKLVRRLMRIPPMILWPVMFVLICFILTAGVTVGKRMLRRVPYVSHSREPGPQSAGMIGSGETPGPSFEDAVQNGLGFKPGSVSDSEFPGTRGIFVTGLVSDDSPAALGNIQAGDVLMELADQPVRNSGELIRVVKSLSPGTEANVKLYRDGQTVTSRIKVADPGYKPFEQKLAARDTGFLGLEEVSRRCCVPATKRWGVEVIKITDNEPADLAGLQAGDVIVEFDKHPIRTPYELSRRIAAAKPRSKMLVKFYRGNTEQTVELIMGHRAESEH